jgi:hypothetical protein
MNRGFSAVVATVLIVSLTVIVGAVLAAFVVPFVKDNLSGSTSCVPVQTYYTFDGSLGHNCYTPSSYRFSIAERADTKGAEEVIGFNLVVQGTEGSGTMFQARAGTGENLRALNANTYPGLPGPGNIKTYRNDTSARYTSAKLYAVLASGKSCEQQEGSITLRQC